MVQIIKGKQQKLNNPQKKNRRWLSKKSPLWLLLSLFIAIIVFVVVGELGITTFLDNNASSYSLTTASSSTSLLLPTTTTNSNNNDNDNNNKHIPTTTNAANADDSSSISSSDISYRAPIMYGTKSGKEETAQLVKDAILNGFRHIVTGGYHQSHNETGVGVGWKLAIDEINSKASKKLLTREDLFLQTCFVPWNGKDYYPKKSKETPQVSIQEQVHISIQTSLQNLQTSYIDAVLFHNFRAQLYPFEKMIDAWKILEEYVDKGIIKYLGITSIHDPNYLQRLMNETRIKPSIVQNRFHSNRQYDVGQMQELFSKYNLQVQRFWLLNGSSGQGSKNKDMAKRKGLTPQQLVLGFVMSLGNHSCLVGTHTIMHMIQDIQISQCYSTVFDSPEERQEYASKMGYKPKEWTYYDDYNGGKTLQHQQQQSCAEIAATTTELLK